ncbi:acyltransferase family protein [Diaphorobacter caeni]|uniref:acyltransferase family protein n=1 Tax=Diaphorobacter caeni TaxID=2784387 RepID=UPI00188E6BD0|nr:acyltransferase [Diaphorobacter caeni]MBF5003981.1 acyltransferase [Diaphorobacter caeni]
MDKSRNVSRLAVLEGLRGLAVSMVFIMHLQSYTPVLWPGQSAFGASSGVARILSTFWIGVDLFFVLSGFFITLAVLRPPDWNSVQFLKNRSTRILPAYYVSMIFAIVTLQVSMLLTTHGWTDLFMHLLLMHHLQEWSFFSINGPYWSLGIEFMFYLFMMASAPFWRTRHGWLMVPLMFVIALTWRSGVWSGVPIGQRFFMASQLPGSLDEFAMGSLVAMGYLRGVFSTQGTRRTVIGLTALLAGAMIVLYCMHAFSKYPYWETRWLVYFGKTLLSTGFTLVLVAFLYFSQQERMLKLVKFSTLGWIGAVSYSVYLYHSVMIHIGHQLIGPHTGPGWLFNGIVVSSTLLLSWLSYQFIERRWHPSLPPAT